MDIFSSGGIDISKATKESGLDKYGWNGEIYGSGSNILEVEQAQMINMNRFMNYVSANRAVKTVNRPRPPRTKTKRPAK